MNKGGRGGGRRVMLPVEWSRGGQSDIWHHLKLGMLAVGRPAQGGDGFEPGVGQDLPGRQAFVGVATQKAANQALGLGREGVGNVEVAAANLAEEGQGLGVVERVSAHQHGVQHYAQTPHVRRLARVARLRGGEDLGADVGRTAMFVLQHVKVVVRQHHSVFQTFQL